MRIVPISRKLSTIWVGLPQNSSFSMQNPSVSTENPAFSIEKSSQGTDSNEFEFERITQMKTESKIEELITCTACDV